MSKGDSPMEIGKHHVLATLECVSELDRLGHEIAELSAHLDAATAHLLGLILEFDARGGGEKRLSPFAPPPSPPGRKEHPAPPAGGGVAPPPPPPPPPSAGPPTRPHPRV